MKKEIRHTFSDAVLRNEVDQNQFLGKVTSVLRTAPSVFILGAQKAGTTSLYQFLVENNYVSPSKRKEIFFFNNQHNFEKGLSWYKSHFPLFAVKRTCDATANYFEAPNAAERLCKHFPEAKLIVLLRNPINRAFSHYQMSVKNGFEKLSFEEALESEDERMILGHNLDHKHNYLHQRLGYRSKGIYVDQLKKWLALFPMNQIHIVQSEELFSNPEIECQKILNFLGESAEIRMPLKKANSGSNNEISDSIRKVLSEFYDPYNQELYSLLNTDFNWK